LTKLEAKIEYHFFPNTAYLVNFCPSFLSVVPLMLLLPCSLLIMAPYGIGQAIIFLPCGFFLLSFFIFLA